MRMKTKFLVALLTLSASCVFAQTPTPPPPGDNAKITRKHDPNAEVHASKSYENARMVAILLNEYAKDNGGKLPAKLEELVPAYVADKDKALIREVEFKTPGAELAKLTRDTVVLSHVKDAKVVIKAWQLQEIKSVAREDGAAKEKAQ